MDFPLVNLAEETLSEAQLRLEALRLAQQLTLSSIRVNETPEETIERAEAYFQFLTRRLAQSAR